MNLQPTNPNDRGGSGGSGVDDCKDSSSRSLDVLQRILGKEQPSLDPSSLSSSIRKDPNSQTEKNETKTTSLSSTDEEEEEQQQQQQGWYRHVPSGNLWTRWFPSQGISTKSTTEQHTSSSTTSLKDDASTSTSMAKDMSASLLQILTGGLGGSGSTKESTQQQRTMQEIVQKARAMGEQRGEVVDKSSLMEVVDLAQQATRQLDQTLQEFFGSTTTATTTTTTTTGDIKINVHPTNLFYYLEYQDEVKNPSWKRRQHRFTRGVGIGQMEELNFQLNLAQLSYTDRMDDIQHALSEQFNSELVYCAMDSSPGKPSHFVALPRDQSSTGSNNALEVWLVVRGTKTMTDVITDLLCDAQPYRNGKAHAGILQSGQYLANKHIDLFRTLLEVSGKSKIHLTLIGHSLGAGAASIAGMELQNGIMDDHLSVQVIGFGCPALLSKELSEEAKEYVTTVIADDDCIPRTSTATMVNAILDISQYDWIPSARRDIIQAMDQVQWYFPTLLTDPNKQRLLQILDDWFERTATTKAFSSTTTKRMEPVLFPPGTCVHFYRDGYGISGSIVPCTFFEELIISRRMVEDHLYHSGYKQIFLDLMRQHHKDHYFQFEREK